MTIVHREAEYLTTDHLTLDYLALARLGALGAQAEAVIEADAAIGVQATGQIATDYGVGAQGEGHIVDRLRPVGSQAEFQILDFFKGIGVQAEFTIADAIKAVGAQAEFAVNDTLHGIGAQVEFNVIEFLSAKGAQAEFNIRDRLHGIGLQAEGHIIDAIFSLGAQVTQIARDTLLAVGAQIEGNPKFFSGCGAQVEAFIVDRLKAYGIEVLGNEVYHRWAGYAVEQYAVADYLEPRFEGRVGAQFRGFVDDRLKGTGAQAQFNIIDSLTGIGAQIEFNIVDRLKGIGFQADSTHIFAMGAQVRVALYNATNLRILCEFPSRGLTGVNWSANTTAAGDFSVNNLNNDLVEKVWRAATGFTSGIQLVCDTELPQGVFVDTLAILSHTMTTSAVLLVEGDEDPAFGSPGFSQAIPVSQDNVFYIAPELPLNGFRYWRFSIDDPTNTGTIQIGSILFGESRVFIDECVRNPIMLRKRHYADEVMTEGFSHVQNDRGIRREVTLNFEKLRIGGGAYGILDGVFQNQRTNLKCLWIPTPQYPSRYAVFGKLVEIPTEEHIDLGEDADYVNMTCTIDEAR